MIDINDKMLSSNPLAIVAASLPLWFVGVVVDSVSDVLNIKNEDIEEELSFGASLDTEYIFGMAKMENGVKILVDIDKVDVHVCETHAGWYGVMPEDFPDYVDVVPAGPVQINDYESMGYELIVLPD